MTQPQPESLPHIDPVREHVELIHRLADGFDGVLVVSTFNANLPSDNGIITHHRPGDVDGMVAAIEAHSETPGANVYCGIQIMRRGLARGKRGSESDVIAVLGLVADMDSDTGHAAGEYPVPPNYVIETSPGNFQPFWLFDRPVVPAVAKGIAKGLKVATGSDHGTADITHVWRIPGTKNWPNRKKLERGRPETPSTVTVSSEWDGTFTDPTALALAVAGQARHHAAVSVELGDLPDVDGVEVSVEAAALLAANDETDRSAHAARIVEKLAFDGHSAEAAAALFLSASGNWLDRYSTEEGARADFARLWGKYGQEHALVSEAGASISKWLAGSRQHSEPPVAVNDNRASVPVPAMHPAPFTPQAAGGLLADISRWITSTAIIPVPELSLMASIALLAGIFGKVALTPTKAGVNIYVTTLLGTAGGKGHPPKAIRAIGDKAGAVGAVTNGDPTSYAAMERILRKNSSTVVVMDEFGITLQDVNAKHRNSVAAGIRKFLLAVYDQANSVFDGRIYASAETKKDDSPIVGPALTVLGMTTVDTLYAGLSEASVADGFLNRFLFVTAAPHEGVIKPPKLDHDASPPAALVEAAQAARLAFPSSSRPFAPKHVVPFEDGEDGVAYKRWGEVFVWQQTAGTDITGRAAENTVRLATIRAISRDPAQPVVNLEDVEWGWAIVHSSIALIRDGMRRHMSASPAEALRKSILAVLEDAPERTIPYSKLLTRTGVRGADLREVEDALQWLVDTGEITDVKARKKPGRGSTFRGNGVGTM